MLLGRASKPSSDDEEERGARFKTAQSVLLCLKLQGDPTGQILVFVEINLIVALNNSANICKPR